MKKINLWIVYICIVVFIAYTLKVLQTLLNTKNIEKEKKKIEQSVEKEKSGQIIEVKLTKTNEVVAMDVNDYIRGVLPSEMPPNFEMEALKAQAIVARTYLYNKMSQNSHADADICDNYNHCQAYYSEEKLREIWKGRGFNEATMEENLKRVNIATNQTTDIVAKYNGECIKAFFHANSGGKTEDSSEIWGGESIAYLKSVESLGEEKHTYYKTVETVSKDKFKKIVNENIDEKYENVNNSVKIISHTLSGRVKEVQIGNKVVKATTMRTLFGLKSTNFTIEEIDEAYVFNVTGYGHGVGMSQTGANYYAKNNMKAEDIIKHYYQGVTVGKINE